MGDPRKLRKKLTKPSHPWQKLRIDEEKQVMKEYGFKNKKELWRLNSALKNFKIRVKDLVPRKDEQAMTEKKLLLEKLQRLSLIKQDAILEDILALSLKNMCERRLQTIVFKKGLAGSIKQARQFVVHGHLSIGEKKITSPSYLLNAQEEALIKFADNSALKDEAHPERLRKPEEKPAVAAETKPKAEEKTE